MAVITGSSRDNRLSGTRTADIILGFGGADTLDGRRGDDLMVGGPGADVADYSRAGEGLTLDLHHRGPQASGDLGFDTLVSIEGLIGSGHDDRLSGDSRDNTLWGGDGADTLSGAHGTDRLDGGAGPDVLEGGDGDTLDGGRGTDLGSFAAAGAVHVDLSIQDSQDTGGAGIVTLDSIEILVGSDFDDTLYGSPGDDEVSAGLGADALIGGDGDDTLRGGDGEDWLADGGGRADDLYLGGAQKDLLSYVTAGRGVRVDLSIAGPQNTRGAGTDILVSIADLAGSEFDDLLTGEEHKNALSGRGGDDTLLGGLGKDLLRGQTGDDILVGGFQVDRASYSQASAGVTVDLWISRAQNTGGDGVDRLDGIENLTGSDFGDALTGGPLSNRLQGRAGDDTLTGGLGGDRLAGGAGADRFVYRSPEEAEPGLDHKERIDDFNRAEGDRIDVSAMDPDPAPGDGRFDLIGSGRFTGEAGQLIVRPIKHGLLLLGDLDGDRVADFAIEVRHAQALMATDFVL